MNRSRALAVIVTGVLASACGNPSGTVDDATPPTVTLSGPVEGGVAGAVQFTANAHDDQGVVAVRFLVNGGVFAVDSTAPFTMTWQSDVSPEGSYAWQAIALDAAGNAGASGTLTYTHGLPTSSLKLVVSTTGVEPDSDGYSVTIAGTTYPLANNDSLIIGPLQAGPVAVAIQGVASNCRLSDSTHQGVTLALNSQTRAVRAFECVNHLSSVQVAIHVSGRNLDSDGFQVTLGNIPPFQQPVNSVATIPALPPGTESFAVSGLAANCALFDPVPAQINISPFSTNRIDINARCLGSITGRVLYGEDGILYSIVADGTGREQITLAPGEFDRSVSASANGGLILYLSPTAMRLMRFDGSNLHTVPIDGAGQAVLSPDGTRIAYSLNGAIVVADTDGTNPTTLVGGGAAFQPCWSPFGDKLAFSNNQILYVVNANGTNLHPISTPNTSGMTCAWSPDATKIAFEDVTTFGIDVIGADGNGFVALKPVNPGEQAGYPHWSGGGSQLIYQFAQPGFATQIFRMTSTGTDAVDVTNAPSSVSSPFWVP